MTSSVIPTVRIDPDGMPDMADGRRSLSDRDLERKARGFSINKDQSKDHSKQKTKPQVSKDILEIEYAMQYA